MSLYYKRTVRYGSFTATAVTTGLAKKAKKELSKLPDLKEANEKQQYLPNQASSGAIGR